MPESDRWNTFGPRAAQLFVDFLYDHDPDNYVLDDIHSDPNRPYKNINKSKFKGYCRTIAKRASTFKEFGTGVSAKFRQEILRVKIPTGVNRKESPFQILVLDEDVEAAEIEEPGEVETEEFSAKSTTPTKDKKQASSKTEKQFQKIMGFKNRLGRSIVKSYPDGRVGVILFLKRRYSPDTFKVRIEEKKKIYAYYKIPKSCVSAERLYQRCKFDLTTGQNLHLTIMQTEINDLLREFKKEGEWERELMGETEFDVLPDFFDENNNETDVLDFDSDDDGLQWIFFWLKGSHVQKKKEPTIRIRLDNVMSGVETVDEESYMEETYVDENEELKNNVDQKFDQVTQAMEQQKVDLQNMMQQMHLNNQQAQHQAQSQIQALYQLAQQMAAGAGANVQPVPDENYSFDDFQDM